jgi:hypothetical protein
VHPKPLLELLLLWLLLELPLLELMLLWLQLLLVYPVD